MCEVPIVSLHLFVISAEMTDCYVNLFSGDALSVMTNII
jgi:hypothetical protein